MSTRILLHICCGPCSIYPVSYLQRKEMEIMGLYLNPNIHPLTEYIKRKKALEEVSQKMGFKVIYKDEEYNPKTYFRQISFREENRCFYCYQMRIERTISIAVRGGFDYFSTTLLYSKFQKHQIIKQLCEDLSKNKIKFFYHDFREGWNFGIEKSKEMGIYRQQYCGCIFSEFERYKKELGR